MADSILRQLAKYQKPGVVGEGIDVSGDVPEDLFGVFVEVLWREHGAASLDRVRWEKKLRAILVVPPVSSLWPVMTYVRYHLFYNCGYGTSEDCTNSEIADFVGGVDKEQYRVDFVEGYSDVAKRITLLKALQASFRYDIGQGRDDRVDVSYRGVLCDVLGLSKNIKVGVVCDMIEGLMRGSCIEDKILSTIGYRILWGMLQGERESVPLLDDLISLRRIE